jgi:hypothetical protein
MFSLGLSAEAGNFTVCVLSAMKMYRFNQLCFVNLFKNSKNQNKMKKLRLLTFLLICPLSAALAQNDTLLFEDFTVDPTAGYALFNSGNDTVWVNYDQDGLADANGRPQEWYWSPGGFAMVDSVDACLFSSSWLTGFLPGNRNWLITPPIDIIDANAVLSWASAPRQTPLYVDGYTVVVSTTDNIEASFTDTLFQAAQYLSGSGFDFAAYTFSPGFVHGEDGTYTEFDATSDSSRLIGVFRPFSESLAQYAGQSIYIAFVHDADDDNLVSIDDILVTGSLPLGVNEINNDVEIGIYPNPVADKIELSYVLKNTMPVTMKIYDVQGKVVKMQGPVTQIAGQQKLVVPVSELAAGNYSVVLETRDARLSGSFVKQ